MAIDLYELDGEPFDECFYCGRVGNLERDEYGELACEGCKETEDENQ